MIPNFDGLKGCFIVLAALAVVGLGAIAYGLWWLLSNISISWGGA